jgi:hypothetical protein
LWQSIVFSCLNRPVSSTVKQNSNYKYDTVMDASYQIQKLALWRKYEVSDFFIGCSLSDLVPFPSISEADFESYQRVLTQLEEILNIRLEEASPKI